MSIFLVIQQHHVKVKFKKHKGYVASSPIYNDKSKIVLEVDLQPSELLELSCPTCTTPVPVYAKCECEGYLVFCF